MYESDTEGASVESEDVGSMLYRDHLITWRTGKYLGFRDGDDRTSFRVTSPNGSSRRITLLRSTDQEHGIEMCKAAIDSNIDRPGGPRVKPSDIERDIISRWVFAQEG